MQTATPSLYNTSLQPSRGCRDVVFMTVQPVCLPVASGVLPHTCTILSNERYQM